MATDRGRGAERVFVVQKHRASRLHFDFRLQIGDTMKSWAVPKGPSLDPSVRRLAVEVDDHPLSYNDFEGRIESGYGKGTVLLWDRGSLEPASPADRADAALARGYRAGRIDFVLRGERLRGAWRLVRMAGDEERPQWLLSKVDDEHADPELDPVQRYDTSVSSGRTLKEIAGE